MGVGISLGAAGWIGFDEPRALTWKLLAIMLPYVVLICAAALTMAVLNATGHFAAPAAAPILLNVTLIAAVVIVCVWPRPLGDDPASRVYALALAVLAGGVLQLAIQWPVMRARGIRLRVRWANATSDPDVRRIGRALGPVVIGLAVFQINVLVDRLIALWLVPHDGAVSVLFLGNRLIQFPLAIFGIALATVALPKLSSLEVDGRGREARRLLARTLEQAMFVIGPAAVGLAILAQPAVQLMFGYGQFAADPEALSRAARVVQLYSVGLVAFGAVTILSRAFYAKGDTKTPMKIGLAAVGLNLALNLALVGPLQEAGLALASSLAAFAQMGLLTVFLWRAQITSKGRDAYALSGKQASIMVCLLAVFGVLGVSVLGALLAQHVILPEVCLFMEGVFGVVRNPASNAALLDERIAEVGLIGGTHIGAGLFCALLFGVTGWLTGDDAARRTAVRTVKIAGVILPMAVLVHWFMWSLPPDGESFMVPLQRALAPLAIGVLAYWFFGGMFQLEEYMALREALAKRRDSAAGHPPAEQSGGASGDVPGDSS